MRRALAAFAGGALASPVTGPVTADPKPGGFRSANVIWQGRVPVDVPGIGAKVVTVGTQRPFYVTGLRGSTVYDVTNPMVPVLPGHLELRQFENEAVSVAADGSLVLIASDVSPQTSVIDPTLPAAPRLASTIPAGSHTVACSDARCSYVYDRADPKAAGAWDGGGHAAKPTVRASWRPAGSRTACGSSTSTRGPARSPRPAGTSRSRPRRGRRTGSTTSTSTRSTPRAGSTSCGPTARRGGRPARNGESWTLDPNRPITFATQRERYVCRQEQRAS